LKAGNGVRYDVAGVSLGSTGPMQERDGSMNVQIFGKRKNFDTQKAERYFKERRIPVQNIDLLDKGLSKGEFTSVKSAIGLAGMIDTESKAYERLNMRYFGNSSVAEETLFKNPELYRAPIVRNGKRATVGFQPDVWDTWQD
jgi:arsenate reductase